MWGIGRDGEDWTNTAWVGIIILEAGTVFHVESDRGCGAVFICGGIIGIALLFKLCCQIGRKQFG